MTAAVLERTARAFEAVPDHVPDHLVLYGDFNCPWSYLAFRRAGMLAAAGVDVDWRAVEHGPAVPPVLDRAERFDALREEIDRVTAMLLPGEQLPYDLAGFVPPTRAAIAAYAEGYAAGVAGPARKVLFESFWMHGIDIADPKVLRTLMVDELRSGSSPSEIVRQWGYAVDVTGGPVSTVAWRLVRQWDAEWKDTGKEVVPVLVISDEEALFGVDAVQWLGEEISARGLQLDLSMNLEEEGPDCRELPSLGWVSENGGRWLHRCAGLPGTPYRRTG